MPIVDESIIINRPRTQVFAFAADPENVPLYSSNLIEFKQLTPGPVQKGTQDAGAVKVAGKRIDWTTEIVEFEEDRRSVSRSIDSPIAFEIDLTYEDVEGGTKVLWHQESDSFGGFFGKLADPLVNRMYAKDVRSNLEKLKELLEAE
ncbi:MAG TPA: SRPBCC family protein [Acidimicrobiia bacterium]|nr:SRPBCC family protein [Acidimicrobiia bacterium]